MRRRALFVLAALAAVASPAPAMAQAMPPGTDIWLAPLERRGDSLVVGPAENVTHRAGYDNQPAFLLDASALLYTSIGADGQADVWRYDIATRRTSRVTATPESEYSPTPMWDGKRFSAVRVERDSAQRLWSFALDGRDPRLLLPAIQPVGYHAWLGSRRLALFVLGTPATLHVVNADGTGDEVRARDVGRAIQRVPGKNWYSFAQRENGRELWITAQPFEGGPPSELVRAPADNEYHAWTPDGALLSASEGAIVQWNTLTGDDGAWVPIAVVPGVKNISRLAVSLDGRWLAFVAEPASP